MKRNIIVKFLNFCSFAKQIILRYLKKPYFIWGLILLLCSILDIWGKVGYGNGVGHRRYIIYSVFISAILSFCIVFLLKKRGLILYLLITVFSILFSLSHLISHICFNQELTGNVYMLILGSSTEEMTAFVKMLAVAPFFWLCLILFGAGIYGLYLLTRYTVKKSTCCICTKNRLKKQFFNAAAIIITISTVYFLQIPFLNTNRLRFIHDCFKRQALFAELAKFMKTDTVENINADPTFKIDSPPIICIVIGESATKHSWSLYGYSRPTTPKMNSIITELLVFQQAKAAATYTSEAMCYFLTNATPENKTNFEYSLPTLFNACGYKTVLISNLTQWNASDGPIAMLFKNCTTQYYIKYLLPPKDIYGYPFDNEILPYFKEEIKSAPNHPLVLFLHLNGSHIPWRDCVPKEYQIYPQADFSFNETPETQRNAYDNSIYFTDSLLGNLVKELKSTNRATSLFYFSDHGDSPSSNVPRDTSAEETWEIPAIIWFSEEYRKDYPETVNKLSQMVKNKIRADEFFFLAQDIAQVKTYNVPSNEHKPEIQ